MRRNGAIARPVYLSTMPLTYRAFDGSAEDYRLLAEILTSESDVVPTSVEELRALEAARKPDTFRRREFVMLGDKCVGEASCLGPHPDAPKSTYYCELSLLPPWRDLGFEAEVFGRLVEAAKRDGAITVTTFARDDRVGRAEALHRMGFDCVMRDPMSRLDLEQFDAAGFSPTLRRVEEEGVAIRSLAQLDDAGIDWLPQLHKLSNELLEDVPRAGGDPPRPWSFEEYCEWNSMPDFQFLPARCVALDGARWVGSTNLSRALANPDVAMTGLTGVVRSHRRRGIATALKVTALERARQLGVKIVTTGNEENNPMLQLNIRLGFRPMYAVLTYRKAL